MKFEIRRNILLENLNNVSKGLSNRNIIPVLNGILFELNEEGLYLTATDSDLTIRTFIPSKDIEKIEKTGKIVITGRFLLDIIKKLTNEFVTIEEVEGYKAIIYTETSRFDLNCFNINDFPNINLEIGEDPIILNSGDFRSMINQIVFATSTQEKIPLLTGVDIKIVNNQLSCVATDSYRLARKDIIINSTILEEKNVVIPANNINELIKIIETDNDNLYLYLDTNKVLFKYKNILFQSSLLNGTYPNTDSLIPKDFEYIFETNLNCLYNAIDRASILMPIKDKIIVQMEIKENKLLITSSSPEIGKVEEVVDINLLKGNSLKISFSAKYMLEALKSFAGETIRIMSNGEIKPIIIKDFNEENLTQLVLPFKTF